MLRRIALASVAAASLACATADEKGAVPYCDETPSDLLSPTAACTADPEFLQFRDVLAQRIVPHAGPLLVRVRLDAVAAFAGVCVERGYGTGQWSARQRIGDALSAEPALPRGPACAASTQLDLNRGEAAYEQVKVLERECRRRNARPWDYSACMLTWQKRRNEIWIQGITRQYRIFTPGAEPADRRTALLACTEPVPAAGVGQFPPIGIARMSVDLEPCMRAQGWDELE